MQCIQSQLEKFWRNLQPLLLLLVLPLFAAHFQVKRFKLSRENTQFVIRAYGKILFKSDSVNNTASVLVYSVQPSDNDIKGEVAPAPRHRKYSSYQVTQVLAILHNVSTRCVLLTQWSGSSVIAPNVEGLRRSKGVLRRQPYLPLQPSIGCRPVRNCP